LKKSEEKPEKKKEKDLNLKLEENDEPKFSFVHPLRKSGTTEGTEDSQKSKDKV
jgi:hypothetical protein